jgi:hypothetical protein
LMRRCLACEAEIETLKRENESLKKWKLFVTNTLFSSTIS